MSEATEVPGQFPLDKLASQSVSQFEQFWNIYCWCVISTEKTESDYYWDSVLDNGATFPTETRTDADGTTIQLPDYYDPKLFKRWDMIGDCEMQIHKNV